ncbi:hypothetical protein C1X59_29170 [Pseudomonas sp. FW215-R2]|uniref:DUF4265 domain-containing protein n=1 Tax=unclassified Pseudomonas TaxID=196821 RepID=UPI000C88595B|nr:MULTISPECIES: DUF4265 domain-containing protein [unclassified Pseudomonas]PMW93957.1 hypothetical protein C1X59_29170 [Pseudomonas sp. FW215-R2]PMX05007.1 hypothetical protein C1X60_29270 [Pseudomonas sp. FW215-L1]PMX16763.1 hypothetical protein C1X57_28940 [Pseudomonas sp. FW215-E1]PNA20939.1 hypothetical protein C1X58_29140 [Pseudomonas sp. FW215-R4]
MSDVFHKIIFELTPDENDYPPVSAESIWGIYKGNDLYQIDNTPYYVYGVSKGDCVQAKSNENELIATKVVKQGGHSTVRVFASDVEKKASIIKTLEQLGASCSSNEEMSLFTVDIPEECNFSALDEYLSSIADGENIAYEDACLQHCEIEPYRMTECLSLASIPFATH